MKTTPFFPIIALFSLLLSCSNSDKKFRTSSPPLGLKNPIIRGTPAQEVGYHVTLEPDALEKPFLMTSNYIHHSFPYPWSLASRVIRFKKRGSELFMFESLVGKSYADTTEDILLTRFPIVHETPKGEITFDFEKGMKLLLFQQRFSVNGEKPKNSSFPITQSYVESVQLKESHILINHSIRAEQGESGTEAFLIRYSLSSYNPDPNFQPSIGHERFQSKVGYFQGNPITAPSQSEPLLSTIKYNASKFPITYYLSPNIPPSLIRPVQEGILYWNDVSGEEIFKTEMLPDNIDPNDLGNHIVHWLDNIDTFNEIAGMADVTNDPITGEILASRVYIPAHIVANYIKYTTAYLANSDKFDLNPTEKKPKPTTLNPVPEFLEQFQSHHHHRHHHHQTMAKISQTHLQQFKKHLHLAAQSNGIFEQYLIHQIATLVAKDSLRKSIAHEIGHTLGLRHNFAASTQTDLNNDNYDETIQRYIKKGELPENFTLSSSVMDYFPHLVGSLIGAHIRHKRPPMIYDKEAIRYLYFKDGNPFFFTSPYCSEDHFDPNASSERTSYYQDCNEFDAFSNPTAWHHRQILEMTEFLPFRIVNGYQQLKEYFASPESKDVDPLEFFQAYPLSTPKQDALMLNQLFQRLARSISKQAQFIQIKHKYLSVTGINYGNYSKQTQEFIGQNIAEFDTISKLLLSHLAPSEEDGSAALKLTSTMEQAFETLLNKDVTLSPNTTPTQETNSEENPDDTSVQAANSEKVPELINQQIKKYLELFERELLLRNIQTLKLEQFVTKDDSFTESLSSFVERVLFEKSPQLLDSFGGVDFYTPQFEYINQTFSEDLRKEAVSLLTHNFYPDNPYYKKEMEEISKNIFTLYLNEVKNLLPNERGLPDKLYNWVFFEKQRFEQIKDDDILHEALANNPTDVEPPQTTDDQSTDETTEPPQTNDDEPSTAPTTVFTLKKPL